MRLLNVDRAGAIVDPLDFAAVHVQSTNKGSHKGPDAVGKINRSIPNNRPTTGWPSGYDPLIAQGFLAVWCGRELPVEFPSFCIDTIKIAIVAANEYEVLLGDRSHSDGTIGVESP